MKENRKPFSTSRSFILKFNSLHLQIVLIFIMVLLVMEIYRFRESCTRRIEVYDENGRNSSVPGCNFFSGKWVFDNKSYPLYRGHQCSLMNDEVACEKYGRKNLKYQHWRWQPHDCDLPRFDATDLLEKLRNQRVVYVGDSLNRNQWMSMVCLIESSIPDKPKRMDYNGSLVSFKALELLVWVEDTLGEKHLLHEILAFKKIYFDIDFVFKEYNVSIDFYWEPLLLESNCDDPNNHRVPERVIRAEAIEKHAGNWNDADVLVFNSYIWWRYLKLKILSGSFESADGDKVYEDAEMLSAYEMALKTWLEWLINHVNRFKTRVFFVSSSPTHNRAEEWGKPKEHRCFYETEPISDEGYWGMDSDPNMMRLVERYISKLSNQGFRAKMLNITQLSEYRKDAHPSMYRYFWDTLTQQQLTTPNYHTDCTHWCLPGVPDVWNEFLYAYLFYS